MKDKLKFTGLAEFNINSERAILAGMIESVDICENLLPYLTDDHFYDPTALQLYKAIVAVHQKGEFVGVTSIRSELLKAGYQSIVENNLDEIIEMACSYSEADYHLDTLNELKTKRYIATSIGQIMAELTKTDSELVLDNLAGILSNAQEGVSQYPSLTPDQIIRREADTPKLERLITGVADIDEIYQDAGLYPGHMLVTIADSGHGKTHFAMYQASLLAKRGYKVHWFQLEDMDLRTAQYFKMRIPDHCDNVLINANIYDIEKIKAEVRRVKRDFNTDYVVIDYIQNVESGMKERMNEVEYVSRQLTKLATELKIVIHMLSQVTIDYNRRTGWKGEPQFNDVRWSKQLKQDAHHTNVIFRPAVIDGLVSPCEQNALDWNSKEIPINSVFLKAIKIRGGAPIMKRRHLIHLEQGLELFENHRKVTELKNNSHRYPFNENITDPF